MEEANERLQAALVASDSEAAITADDDFHAVALTRSGNPLILDHLEVVTATLRRAEYLHFDSEKGSASPNSTSRSSPRSVPATTTAPST